MFLQQCSFEHRFQDFRCLFSVFHQNELMSALHDVHARVNKHRFSFLRAKSRHPYRRPFHHQRSRSTSSSLHFFFHKSAGFISEKKNKKNRFKKSSSKDSKRYLISLPLGGCINNVTWTNSESRREIIIASLIRSAYNNEIIRFDSR